MPSRAAARAFVLIVQQALAMHFRGVVLAADLFAVGVPACLHTFVKSGRPAAEGNPSATPEYA